MRAEKGLALAQVVKCIGRAQGSLYGALQMTESNGASLDSRVKSVLYPGVSNCAVVALNDTKWGEAPVAFVEVKEDVTITEEEIHDYCVKHLAKFKVPKYYVFGELSKTAAGKIQKFALRRQALELFNLNSI